jgi:hypothetical protein
MKKTILTALLAGAALFAAAPADAADGWQHHAARPGPVAHARFHNGHWGARARFTFRHDFRHFTPVERRWWNGGHWHHRFWHGRWGWWWGVGGTLYWYPAPVYPYPTEVSPTYYDDDSYDYDDDGGYDNGGGAPEGYDGGGGPGGSWYHCSNPEGYYPYVKSCPKGWEEVPAQPSDMQGGAPNGYGPDSGPPPGDQYDDEDQDDQGPPPR